MSNAIKIFVSAVGTAAAYLTGGWSASVITLLIFLAADYITGIACAIAEKNISSRIGFKGLIKKCIVLVILIVAVMLDRLLCNNMWLFRTAVCYFYIANEGISILENAARLGVPIPQKLLSVLGRLAQTANDDKNDGYAPENDSTISESNEQHEADGDDNEAQQENSPVT